MFCRLIITKENLDFTDDDSKTQHCTILPLSHSILATESMQKRLNDGY